MCGRGPTVQHSGMCRDLLEAAADAGVNSPASLLARQLQSLPRDGIARECLWPLIVGVTPQVLTTAFKLLDSRSAGPRAVEVFARLRAALPGDPLSGLCTTATYSAIVCLVRTQAVTCLDHAVAQPDHVASFCMHAWQITRAARSRAQA
jgi:hypothetical protein